MSRPSLNTRPARRTKLFPARTMPSTMLMLLVLATSTLLDARSESPMSPVGSVIGSGPGVSSSSSSSSSGSSSSVIDVASDVGTGGPGGNGIGGNGGNGLMGNANGVGGGVNNGPGHSGGGHSGLGAGGNNGYGRCEEITIPMCRGIGYNLTAMPNELNHDSQDEAGLEVHQFWPLVEIKCSPDLKFFLCSMYAPICLPEYTKPLPACRSVCERARAGCAPLMQQYGFSWPERMGCERLPNHGEDPENLCMEQDNRTNTGAGSTNTGGAGINGGGASSGAPAPPVPPARPTRPSKSSQPARCKPGKNQKNCQHPPGERTRDCACRCRAPLVPLGAAAGAVMPGPITGVTGNIIGSGSTGANQPAVGLASIGLSGVLPAAAPPAMVGIAGRSIIQEIAGVPECALPCRGAFLTNEEREFAAVWLALWSGLCAASTLVTVITFLIDTQRFKYPERPIVFLSACYFVVSVGYLSRSVLGHEEIACDGPALKSGAQGPGACVTVFLMIYFFGMASSVWWVILAFTWFLAAGLKWGNEAIASYSQYFHLVAWLAPTIQTVWAYVAGGVAGDPVAGVCTVAPEGVRNFILAPLFIYLLLGTSFLLAGFVSLFRIRSVIKRQPGAKADKLEKLMIRIGVFSVLYTLPAGVVLACHIYELYLRDDWLASLACPCRPRARPLYSVLMLKYFMALAVGITSGVWIWSGKTVDSWKRLWRRLFGGNHGPGGHMGAGAGMVAGMTGSGIGGVGIKGVVGRGVAVPYQSASGPGSALLPPGSVASASQHHLHHHVLKQPPLSHV